MYHYINMYYIIAMHRHFILPTEDHVCVIRVNSSVLKLIQRRERASQEVSKHLEVAQRQPLR